MIITYDKSADAAYIYLKKILQGEVAKTYSCNPIEVGGEINLDFDSAGYLIGIEILNASKKLPANLLDIAETPD